MPIFETVTYLGDNNDTNRTFGATNDLINADGGNDINIFGGGGDDHVHGGNGGDAIGGGAGDDILSTGRSAGDTAWGGPGSDTFFFEIGRQNIHMDAGADVLRILDTRTTGINVATVSDFDIGRDLLDFTRLTNIGSGTLTVEAKAGGTSLSWGGSIGAQPMNEVVLLGVAESLVRDRLDDVVDFARGREALGAGESLRGTLRADTVTGGAGDDYIRGKRGADRLSGRDGEDFVDGGPGADTLRGGNHDDRLLGGLGQDRLFGGAGDDALQGGAGNDILNGDRGDDLLLGGAGRDTFRFLAGTDFGFDEIADFNPNRDVIHFRGPATAADLQIERFGADALLQVTTASGGGTILLTGVMVDELSESNFLF